MHSKAFFATIPSSYAAKSLDSLGNTLEALGKRARPTKFGTCRVSYNDVLVRASGKGLAQGKVALINPI